MEHIDQMLHKLFSEIAKKHHNEDCTIRLKPISSGGANYSSVLYTATVSSPNKEDLQLFAKVAVLGEEIRGSFPDGIDLFGVEYFVYSELAMKFKEIEEKYAVPEEDQYTFCKYYGYNSKLYEETIVLENLAAKGFIVHDRMKSVDWPYASKAVESLAKFHALSMVYGELYPEETKKMFDKFDIFEQGYKMMDIALKKFVEQALEATKVENKDKLVNFFDNEVNRDLLYYTKPRQKAFLIHGDYRPSNLMHRVNKIITSSAMERIEHMLRKLFSEIAKKHHYEDCTIQLRAISSGGANYSSVLYTATVSSPNKEDLQLFAKVAVLGKEIRAMADSDIDVFDIEYTVYSTLADKFKEIEDKCAVPEDDRYIFCKYYGYNPKIYEETIVLENLAAKGFIVYDRMKSVDWAYASKAVESLAKFHALAMVYGELYPEECNKLIEKFKIIELGYKMLDGTLRSFLQQALKVIKPENKDKLAKFFDDKVHYDVLHYTKPRRKAVLIHGDYRPSNLMHRVNEDGTVEVIPLDFQTIRAGCVVSDLLYFIFGSTDQEFRAKYYEQLVELYYQQLCRSLRLLHFDPEKVYSREDFDTELKEVLPYGLICSVMLLPIITVEPENAPDIHEDNLFESMAKTKTSALYPERLNGIIDDYVRWGVI